MRTRPFALAFSAGLALLTVSVYAQMPSTADSLLNRPPSEAQISTNGGQLTIAANNSSLRDILSSVERQTGTKVQGMDRDIRIFGTYGPGKPSEVLASLLDGSDYNVIIAGAQADGFPREVNLSAKGAAAPHAATPQAPTQASQEADDDAQDYAAPPPPQDTPAAQPTTPMPQNPQPLLPAANGDQSGQGQQQVKTPQQLLQELQQLRQQSPPSQPQ